MGKIGLSDIVNLPAFDEAGSLFHRATGMTISFPDDAGNAVFYPVEERCELCHLIQSTPEGAARCQRSDLQASERALRSRKPIAYTCHAGLTDVVVPVVVGGEKVGCFYSGQSLLTPQTAMGYQEIKSRVTDLGLDPDELWDAYMKVPLVDGPNLEVAMGLLSVISNHLVEGEIALRKERELTLEQRKLRKSAEEKARLERDLREMELKLLQAQMNPHFLFNSLNLILGQAMVEGASETTRLIDELSVLMRASLSTIGSMAPLVEEIASARAYVEIFRARFGHSIDLRVDLPNDLHSFEVPALILQPMVENSLIHSFPTCSGPFRLEIQVRANDSHITLTVADNGKGGEKEQSMEVTDYLREIGQENKLTGLAGVNRRLKYYYPDISDIRIISGKDGFAVEMTIPR
jgi:ligand-binding sensor protein/two-component sensor histidine kinase